LIRREQRRHFRPVIKVAAIQPEKFVAK